MHSRPDLPAAGRSGVKYAFLHIYVQYVKKYSFREGCLCVCRHLHIYAAIMQVAAIIKPAFSQSFCWAENSGGDVYSCIGNQLGLLQTNAVLRCGCSNSSSDVHFLYPLVRCWLFANRFSKRLWHAGHSRATRHALDMLSVVVSRYYFRPKLRSSLSSVYSQSCKQKTERNSTLYTQFSHRTLCK